MTADKTNLFAPTRAKLAKNLHYILLLMIAMFVLSALVAGELFGAYENFWWWDDALHTFAGVIIGLVGLLSIYYFNSKHTMDISPLFVAVFVFCFAMAMGAVWEIFEFAMDLLFGLNMQRWDMPTGSIVIGAEYQGMGLRDTMSDIITSVVGSSVAAVFSYFAWGHRKGLVIAVMRRFFPWLRR